MPLDRQQLFLLAEGKAEPDILSDRERFEAVFDQHILAQVPFASLPRHPVAHRQWSSARHRAAHEQRKIVYELKRVTAIMAQADIRVVALKGAAYALLALKAADGRRMSDLDILIQEADLDAAEQALRQAGYEDHDPLMVDYDRSYYRDKMHELPPLVHPKRGVTIDLHFRLTPRTARLQVPMDLLWQAAEPTESGAINGHSAPLTLGPIDMFLHAALHALYDGSVDYPLRSYFDLSALYARLTPEEQTALPARAKALGLEKPYQAARIFIGQDPSKTVLDWLIWSRQGTQRWAYSNAMRGVAALILYARGHLLRMPLHMLVRHMGVKLWRVLKDKWRSARS